jgi:hypothetical protein
MSMQIKFKLTRAVIAIWPIIPVSIKVALYKHHRKVIQQRTTFFEV